MGGNPKKYIYDIKTHGKYLGSHPSSKQAKHFFYLWGGREGGVRFGHAHLDCIIVSLLGLSSC